LNVNKRLFSTNNSKLFPSNNNLNIDKINVNTLNFYQKLNGDVPINQFDPNIFGSNAFYKIKNILSSNTINLNVKQELIETSLNNYGNTN